MNQFVTTQNAFGDMTIEAGVVIDITAATTGVFPISPGNADGLPVDPGVSVTRAAPRFAGGSGRNLSIPEAPTAAVPGGWMIQTAINEWTAEDGQDGLFKVRIADDGKVEWVDEFDEVSMTAPAGSIPIANRFACAAFVANGGLGGGSFIIDLGTATGLVTLDFNAITIPDIFRVEYDGVEVINTGYRGTSGTYDGVVVTIPGSPNGSGSASFTKSTASPTFATVTVEAPFTGTAWSFELGCPAAGAPPYTTPAGRTTFTASSTAYGQTQNGGTAFTRSVTFEGAQVSTVLNLTSDTLPDSIGAFGNVLDFYQTTVARWVYFNQYAIEIQPDGTSNLIEVGGIIAIRTNENYLDPSGSYAATTYGRDKYNNGVEFNVGIAMLVTKPIELYTYLELTIAAGSVTGVKGPYSAPTLPNNTASIKHVPISYSDGDGRVTQYYEGALFWK